MDVLNDPNLDPDTKILILFYIIMYVLPELLNEMPEICQDNKKLQAAWLLKELKSKK
jgi:hypothetical protein